MFVTNSQEHTTRYNLSANISLSCSSAWHNGAAEDCTEGDNYLGIIVVFYKGLEQTALEWHI